MAKKNTQTKLKEKKLAKKSSIKKNENPIVSGIISGVLVEEDSELELPTEKEVSPDALEGALEDEEDVAADIESMDDEDLF